MNLNDIVARANTLPPISPAALRLMALLDRSNTCNDDIVHALKYDSVLTSNVLRLCNSPSIGLRMPVTSIDQAVLLLGHRRIHRIILTLAFSNSICGPRPGYAIEANELWRHSLITALAAELLAERAFNIDLDPSVAFTSGLLHDIGKLLLNQVLAPEIQAGIRAGIEQKGLSLIQAETDILQTDHAEVGGCLLRHWNLPGAIVEAVANHHRPLLEPRPRLSAVVHVANCLAHVVGSSSGSNGYVLEADPGVEMAIGVESGAIEGLIHRIEDSLREVEQLMS
jgi:putative nucleotidyltransferase with HDIG domain